MEQIHLAAPGAAPLEIEVWRGEWIESRHRVSVVVADADARLVAHWGDAGLAVYPRSAVKPLQSLPLLETGTADRFQLTDAELSLACASHGGEPRHEATVGAMLAKAGLGEADLACGSHWPLHAPSSEAMMRAGRSPGPLHNNCSGEHAGMLLTARHKGEPVQGYLERGHPAQQRIEAVLGEMCGIDIARCPAALDGCSAPVFAIPLRNLATGMARFAAPGQLGAIRAAAARRLANAIAAEPFMIAGNGRFCTIVNEAAAGSLICKTGAEGVFCAAIPGLGLGVALKALDGATRAAECALIAILGHLGALTDPLRAALGKYSGGEIRNWNGRLTGRVLPHLVSPQSG